MLSISRHKGCLLGLATGDALGALVEGMPRGRFLPVKDMDDCGYPGAEPGYWTDDTSMALCLVQSLLDCGGFDAMDQMARYLRWLEEGYMSSRREAFGIGATVAEAIYKFKATKEPYCGSKDPYTAGNGTLMRLAPAPMYYAYDFGLAVSMSGQSSRTTHAAAEAVDACRYLGGLIQGALAGEGKERLLSANYAREPGFWDDPPLSPKIAAIASGEYKGKRREDIRGTAYVADSLEAALWCFYNTTSFDEGALMAVNLGDDTDTTAAVYGQLAGAHYGLEAIPTSWLEKLHGRKMIEDMAEAIFKRAMEKVKKV